MTLFISVVNHHHDEMICNNMTLAHLATKHSVILKSNTIATENLKSYCKQHNIHLLQGTKTKGFGANNNEVFRFAEDNLGMKGDDYFLVLNPDVEIELETIDELMKHVTKDNTSIATINLFRDRKMTIYDNSIRHFPSLLNPIKSLLKIKRTDHYDKSQIKEPINVDWAAGSFLLFKSEVYKKLKGFDERYFMYFEDVDICRIASKLGISIVYYPSIKAVHYAQFSNRKILSKNNLIYIKSWLKYHLKLKQTC